MAFHYGQSIQFIGGLVSELEPGFAGDSVRLRPALSHTRHPRLRILGSRLARVRVEMIQLRSTRLDVHHKFVQCVQGVFSVVDFLFGRNNIFFYSWIRCDGAGCAFIAWSLIR